MAGCLFPIRRWSVKSWAELRYHHHRRQSFGPATTPLASRLSADFAQKSIAWLTSRCSPLPSSLGDFPLLCFSFLIMQVQKSDLVLALLPAQRSTHQTRPDTGSARKLMFWVSGILFIYLLRFFGFRGGSVTDPVGFLEFDTKDICPHENAPECALRPLDSTHLRAVFLLDSVTVQSIVSIEQRVLVKTAVSWCAWCVSSEKQEVGVGHSTRHCICAVLHRPHRPFMIWYLGKNQRYSVENRLKL